MSTHSFRHQAGMSLAVGIIWASAAAGDAPLFPAAQYTAGREPASFAIGDINASGEVNSWDIEPFLALLFP